MLTLDDTTLFYWNLRNETRSQREGTAQDSHIKSWLAAIQAVSGPASGSQLLVSRALTRRLKTPSCRPPHSISSHSSLSGGSSDFDELEGEGHKEVHDSPVKRKRLATSKHIIVEEPKPRAKRRRVSSQVCLPPECHVDDVWAKHVVPTLVHWLGCQKTLWYPVPELVLGALRTTCQKLYSDEVVRKIPLDSIEDEPFILITKRFEDHWRNMMASSAQAILTAYFESDPELAESADKRATFAEEMLEHYRFCFSETDHDNPKRWRGAFRGPLINLTFSSHWNCVHGFVNIEELKSDFTDGHARGALALACSAVKHALLLWRDRVITVDAVQDIRGVGRSTKLKAKQNKSTGKKTTAYTAFSGADWKNETKRFLKSIMTLSTEVMDEIVAMAKAQSIKTGEEASALVIDDDDDILRSGSESSESEPEGQALWRSHVTKTKASMIQHDTHDVHDQDLHLEGDNSNVYHHGHHSLSSKNRQDISSASRHHNRAGRTRGSHSRKDRRRGH